ncbi:unnamed protein product [Brachionus calyciflorus]|uniref:Peptidase S1 domain-containing protein n=1 Tax=Brachionus calyciflorus TaxID=104777 RepID=A0A814MS27_9BILA|nr:unnamed protein product [Brachionus calyciflorus]
MKIHNIILTLFMSVSVFSEDFLSCGKPSISNYNERIINGESALSNSWPWMVSIRQLVKSSDKETHYHMCGGSIISPNLVLTSAHCVFSYSIEVLSATIGSNYLNETNQTYYSFSEIFIHPDYALNPKKNNIALLKLASNLTFKENISPICLPTSSNVSTIFDQSVVVLGWGSTNGENNRSKLSNTLLQATLKIQNEEKPSICKNLDSYLYCALDPSVKKSNFCFGDSGGPLMFFNDEKWYLYGIPNFVIVHPKNMTCMNKEPGFFTMVPNYLNWIETVRKNPELLSTTTKLVSSSIHKSPKKLKKLTTKKKNSKTTRLIIGKLTSSMVYNYQNLSTNTVNSSKQPRDFKS